MNELRIDCLARSISAAVGGSAMIRFASSISASIASTVVAVFVLVLIENGATRVQLLPTPPPTE